MLCARDIQISQIPLPAFRVETVSTVTVQCWERQDVSTLLALDEASTLLDILTYAYILTS